MTKKKIKLIDQFKAISETGKIFTLLVRQEFLVPDSFEGYGKEIPGFKTISTSTGQHVNRIDDAHYEIVASGIKVTKL